MIYIVGVIRRRRQMAAFDTVKSAANFGQMKNLSKIILLLFQMMFIVVGKCWWCLRP